MAHKRVQLRSIANRRYGKGVFAARDKSKKLLTTEILISEDLPITEVEIEVFAALLDDSPELWAVCDKDDSP